MSSVVLSWWLRLTHHPSHIREYPCCARLCWVGKIQPGPRQAEQEEGRRPGRQKGRSPGLLAPGTGQLCSGNWASPLDQGLCRDLPPEGSGTRWPGSYQEPCRLGSTHRQSCLCRGGAGGGGHKGRRSISVVSEAGQERARQVTPQAFCGRPVRPYRVGGSHLSKGQFFFILAEVYKHISCARPM